MICINKSTMCQVRMSDKDWWSKGIKNSLKLLLVIYKALDLYPVLGIKNSLTQGLKDQIVIILLKASRWQTRIVCYCKSLNHHKMILSIPQDHRQKLVIVKINKYRLLNQVENLLERYKIQIQQWTHMERKIQAQNKLRNSRKPHQMNQFKEKFEIQHKIKQILKT